MQLHTGSGLPRMGGRRTGLFHGQGGIKDVEKDAILRFSRAVDRGLMRVLRGDHAPLILAGVEPLLSIFREASSYPHLLGDVIPGNPQQTSDDRLRDRGWEILEPRVRERYREAAEVYRRAAGTRRGSADIEDVVRAGVEGRIATLFVAADRHVWGSFDRESRVVRRRETDFPDREDLLNVAAHFTLAHGGDVHTVASRDVPGGEAVAAVLRY